MLDYIRKFSIQADAFHLGLYISGGESEHLLASRYILRDKRAGTGHHAIRDNPMVRHAHLASQDDAVMYHDTAGQAGLSGQQACLSDTDIVSNLNQIVNFCSGTDHGIAEFGTINARAGTDFDAVFEDNAAVMWN